MRRSLPIAALPLALVAATVAPCAAQPAEHQPPPAAAPASIQNAKDLLDALQASDASLRTYQATVVYDKRFALQADQHIRRGKLYFSSEPDKAIGRDRRRFAVTFDTLQIEEVVRPEQQALIFDGEWLVEKREAEKQWTATRLAPADAPIDPLSADGPLPIPFGQSAEAILSRFDAALAAPEDGLDWGALGASNYLASATGSWQLVLTPREGTPESERFREVRLWYIRDASGRLLPRLAYTIDRKGDESFVQLVGPQVNGELPPGVIDMSEPDPALGWTIQREPRE